MPVRRAAPGSAGPRRRLTKPLANSASEPGCTIEVTLGYEQVAVDLTAWIAQHEPDPYLKQIYDFALLEDFDHLNRYANP